VYDIILQINIMGYIFLKMKLHALLTANILPNMHQDKKVWTISGFREKVYTIHRIWQLGVYHVLPDFVVFF
jgi:hypothetical protein